MPERFRFISWAEVQGLARVAQDNLSRRSRGLKMSATLNARDLAKESQAA